MTIGERLKNIRIYLGLSQAELAETLGTHSGVISTYENNKRTIQTEYLTILREKHNINIHWILLGEGQMLSESENSQELLDKITDKDKEIERLNKEVDRLQKELIKVQREFLETVNEVRMEIKKKKES